MAAGLLLSIAVAAIAYALGRAVPVVGGPVFGIAIGAAIALTRAPGARYAPGIRFASKQLLQTSIVLLGATLQLKAIAASGVQSLPVMLGTLVLVLAAAYALGRVLGIDRDLRRLLGVGTAICGGSAIAALSSVIDVDQTQVAYAITTVFLFNVAAVLTFPWIGHALALAQHAFGLWAGTAINDTSSVVAAGFVYGREAGTEAVIVKLTRTLLIVPLVLFYAGKRVWAMRAARERIDWASIFPWFIVWFVVAALLDTAGIIPRAWHEAITQTALFLIVLALSAVGLSTNGRAIRQAGIRPIVLGFALWALIACSSLAIAHVIGAG